MSDVVSVQASERQQVLRTHENHRDWHEENNGVFNEIEEALVNAVRKNDLEEVRILAKAVIELRKDISDLKAQNEALSKEILDLKTQQQEDRREIPIEEQVEFIDGIPYVNKEKVAVEIREFQDCKGAETEVRSDEHYGNLGLLGPLGIKSYPIPMLSPDSIGATLASIIGEIVDIREKSKQEPFILENGTVSAIRQRPLVILANSAPRRDSDHNPGKAGAPFVFARLGHNIFYFGTNSVELGYVKDHINGEVREVPIRGSNTYRSRKLPERISRWRKGDMTFFGSIQPAENINLVQNTAIRIADNFGNVKTGLRVNDPVVQKVFQHEMVFIKINGRISVARTAAKLQDGGDGKLLFAKGSSIHDTSDLENHQIDLFVKNGKVDSVVGRFFPEYKYLAADLAPVAGSAIEISPVTAGQKLLAGLVERVKVVPAWLVKPFVNNWIN